MEHHARTQNERLDIKTTTCYMCACRCGIRVHLRDGEVRYIRDGDVATERAVHKTVKKVTEDIEYSGCPMKAGDKVLMNFPAANRDPEAFDQPDEVVLDRAHNRHVAFGSGIHRCAGSNLARMELTVALEEWLARIPDFSLAPGEEISWAGGQVRGPRVLPVVF